MPVLSVQITVTEPSVSTLGSFCTRALRRASRCSPSARAAVTIAGSPSGMAATARLTASISTSASSPPRASCRAAISATRSRQSSTSWRPSLARRRCSGVCGDAERSSRPAMCPSSVLIPVAVTTARPRPEATIVPMWSMFSRSASGAAWGSTIRGLFATVCDSPVSAASCVNSELADVRRASAGTLSPASISIRSPGTSSRAGTTVVSPSRTTRAVGAA